MQCVFVSDVLAPVAPWQRREWQRLLRLLREQRLPHALLLRGLSGTGVGDFARGLAHRVLCRGPLAETPCGSCRDCVLNAAGTHPDLLQLAPERSGGAIRVEQVREVVAFGQATAQQGGYRVVIINPAHAMNASAANALLKTLEEPGRSTLLLLVTSAPGMVMPTIRSRCQDLALPAPAADLARGWLGERLDDPQALQFLSGFAPRQPLYALRLAPQVAAMREVVRALVGLIGGTSDPMQTAASWLQFDTDEILQWLYQWLTLACVAPYAGGEPNEHVAAIHAGWTAAAPIGELLALVDDIVLMRRQLLSGTNPNRQLLLEALTLALAARRAPVAI